MDTENSLIKTETLGASQASHLSCRHCAIFSGGRTLLGSAIDACPQAPRKGVLGQNRGLWRQRKHSSVPAAAFRLAKITAPSWGMVIGAPLALWPIT